ncbi:hypothetical protein KKA13_01765 [Patescibacteria group bacterium]|nr:hypothetical protein [Patescibacteria group bacterium]
MKDERPLVLHKGVYKKPATVGEAVFMITGLTIGAGILGVPYVVAQVGLIVGLIYILVLGLVVLSLNLMVGEIAVRAGEPLQLPGLAGKYLGSWAKRVLSVTIILGGYGSLLAYVIGEGEALSALFGGNKIYWSVFFWSIASFLVWRGLQTVKRVDRIVSFSVIAIISILSFFLFRYFDAGNWQYINISKIFLPYGVILFALHGSPAIVEAHALLPNKQKSFKKAVIIGTLIPIAVYMLFALAVVGAGGLTTTDVASVGIGYFGTGVLLAANIYAILAMGTAFLGMGMALKQILTWDYKLPKWSADALVVIIPLFLFTAGLRSFIFILEIVGGLFIGTEAVLMVLTCWKARQARKAGASRYDLRNFWLLAVPVMIVFTFATVYSIVKLFI